MILDFTMKSDNSAVAYSVKYIYQPDRKKKKKKKYLPAVFPSSFAELL